MVGYFMIAALAGVVCAVVANGKGRNAVAWFAIGFLLPLLGIILALVLPAERDAQSSIESTPTTKQTYRDDLRMLVVLRDRGVLSEQEFEDKKHLVIAAERAANPVDPVADAAAAELAEAKAMLATAQTRHFAKEFDEAKRTYQNLVTRFPSSKQADVARQQLINLKSA